MFDKNTAKHLAELSKIEFTDAELSEMVYQMDDIIKLMDTVKGFDVSCDRKNRDTEDYRNLREDRVNTSQNKGASYAVPKII